jgi:GNAT superfamily N-acetyltransferase
MDNGGKEIIMIRDNLDQIPDFVLPRGFDLRMYQSGDEKSWETIQFAADKYNEISSTLFYKEFGHDVVTLEKRQFYLCADDHPVGTATAWFDVNFKGKEYGLVHWVAILPTYQGLGLAKPLMTAVCRRLKELGHVRAYLTTSTARIPAINLYEKFGFRQVIVQSKCDEEKGNDK